MNTSNLLVALALAFASLGIYAQPAPASGKGVSAASVLPMAEGEVRKVDKDAGKVTLRHGPIANLDMPAMTMVFKVANPNMLHALKDGDKVRFSADRLNGAMTVTAIEAAN